LFAIIGTSFGVGDGSTTFNLPDSRGRVFGSIGQGTGLSNRTLGGSVGSENHQITNAEMPSHNHIIYGRLNAGLDGSGNGIITTNGEGLNINSGALKNLSQAVINTGGNSPHNNMQPTLFGGNTFIFSGV
jgi:microcystin-dependent protein